MTKQELFNITMRQYNEEASKNAKKEWDRLAKPLDGMGDFEGIICDIAAIQGKAACNIDKRVLLVFCADNGIVKEGVSQSSQEITLKVAMGLGRGVSSACCLAKSVNAKVIPIDVGINTDVSIRGVLNKKVTFGTKDFLEEPAMTEEQVLAAISVGIEMVMELAGDGVGLIATGEMGIGNTTTSTAVLCALLGMDSEAVTGRGAGLDDAGLDRKKEVIRAGIEKFKDNFEICGNEAERAFEILRCLGGLDIAAMCGAYIGGGIYGVPIVIDGVISSVAAILAERMRPGCNRFMIASHAGREAGNVIALKALGKSPYINGNMALGEGTGALMLIPLIDSAMYFYQNGIRFDECGIDDYERYGNADTDSWN